MRRNQRDTRRSSYPATPNTASTTRSTSSAPFQYSIARPPTDYSSRSLNNPPSPAPPLPQPIPSNRLLVHAEEDEDADNEGDTPLYARSDWTGAAETPMPPRAASGYSESEYPPTTALRIMGDGRETPLYARSDYGSPYTAKGEILPGRKRESIEDEDGEEEEDEKTGVGKWEENNTAWSKSSYAPRGTVLDTVYEDGQPTQGEAAYEGYYDDVSNHGANTPGYGVHQRRSSPGESVERANPFDDRQSIYDQNPPYTPKKTRKVGQHKRNASDEPSAELLTPEAQQRLGRMSVAPPRYTLPPLTSRQSPGIEIPLSGESNPYAPAGGLRFQQNLPHPNREKNGLKGLSIPIRPDDALSRLNSNIGQLYLTYRPFITPASLLTSAMILTLAMQSGGTLGTFVEIQPGGFGGKAGEGNNVIGLGVSEWCHLNIDNPTCKKYKKGDFVSSTEAFQIPGSDSLQSSLSNLLAALTALTWLLATYHLTSAFLHFFLLFGLSIPWNFFTTSDPLPPLTGVPKGMAKKVNTEIICLREDQIVQKEVDLRVRCERPPYEAYGWVWWAWWAHRRGPVGHAFGALAGAVAVCTMGVGVAFYMQVVEAVADDKASLATGTLVPVIALILSLDPITSAVKYLINARYNFDMFNAPPSPTPAAILLPPNIKPMRHIRKTGALSYFASPEDVRTDTLFVSDPLAPPLPTTGFTPKAPLDPETIRWLAAYPLDPDLVSLISDLQAGGESDDFVLSDVGLLYLRPDPADGGSGDALLVPPAGQIRGELLKDAHLELVEDLKGDQGESAHWGPETMMSKLGETFWWPGIDDDCRKIVEGCERCQGDGIVRDGEFKPGMTPLLFTGMRSDGDGRMTALVTNAGESAMAADMAFAMRRAEDDAKRVSLRF